MELLHTLGIDPRVILTNIISFLLLVWLMGKYLVGPISEVLRQRREEIDEGYRKITDETARLAQLQSDLDKRLTEIETEARSKIQEAALQGAQLKEEILTAARAQAEQIKERGIADIERERDKALASIRKNVAALVVQASEKVLQQSISAEKHHDLIQQTIFQMENLKN